MKIMKLGDVADLIMGQSPPGDTYNTIGNGYPFFQGKSEFGKVSPTAIKWCTHPKKIAQPGDILISVRAPVGPTNLANQKCCIGRGLAAIRPEPKSLDRDFIWLFLQYSEKTLVEKGQGSTFEAINGDDLKSFKIPIPTIEKQRQIAACLKAQLAEVDKARQAAEAQWRHAKQLHTSILKETFINGASANWPKIALGEIGEVVAGVTLGRKINGKITKKISYLRVANVKDGYLDLSDVSTIEATESEINRLLLKPGDILLTEGGDPDKLGRGTYWKGELDECIHQNHIFRVRFPAESYMPEFIAAQIGSVYGKDYFFAHAKKTTGIATINQKVLKKFPVLSPSIEIQKAVMSDLNKEIAESERIISSGKLQLAEITILPRKILAQAFGDFQP